MTESMTMTLALPENPTTGYKWSVDGIGYELKVDTYVPSPGSFELVGGGGTRVYSLRIDLTNDEAYVVATYRQPWEGGKTARELMVYTAPSHSDDASH